MSEENNIELDQFFTKPEKALELYKKAAEILNFDDYDIFLEPSVGANSFGSCFPKKKRVLMDIDPKQEVFEIDKNGKFKKVIAKKKKIDIIQMDFLSFGQTIGLLGMETKNKIISIGNPPFGKNSSLAVQFFNICADFCEAICFIIPRTFKRVSVQNQLDMRFKLVYNEDLPYSSKDCVFEPRMNAKCCFQIWVRTDEKREKIKLPSKHKDWTFLPFGELEYREGCSKKQPTPPKNADFAMKAYGSNCGEIVTTGLSKLRPKSWHWFKCDKPKWLINRFNQLDYSISEDTVRQNSIGRADLVKLYTDKFGG